MQQTKQGARPANPTTKEPLGPGWHAAAQRAAAWGWQGSPVGVPGERRM